MTLLLPGMSERHVGEISLDAKCWNIREDSMPVPEKGIRRILMVVTLDDEGEYEPWFEDLGPAQLFPAIPFGIPTGYYTSNGKRESLMSVGHALDALVELRGEPLPDATQEYFETAPAQFAEDVQKAEHETRARRVGRSLFGPGGKVIR